MAHLLPCSVVLPSTSGFPQRDTLTLLQSTAMFILFIVSGGFSLSVYANIGSMSGTL